MWIACAIPVGIIIFQAFFFMGKARQAGRDIDIPEAKIKQAIRASAITSIGPSLVILSGMLSLLVTVGGPVGWMRLSLIGSVMFEGIAAGIGTQQVGVTLGTDPMTPTALAMAVWTMVLCSIGWVVFATFSASRMDKIQHKITGGSTKRMGIISGAAIIACFSSFECKIPGSGEMGVSRWWIRQLHSVAMRKRSPGACRAPAGAGWALLLSLGRGSAGTWAPAWLPC